MFSARLLLFSTVIKVHVPVLSLVISVIFFCSLYLHRLAALMLTKNLNNLERARMQQYLKGFVGDYKIMPFFSLV